MCVRGEPQRLSVLVLLCSHSWLCLFSAVASENNITGESPFSPQGGAASGKEVVGHQDKGPLC